MQTFINAVRAAEITSKKSGKIKALEGITDIAKQFFVEALDPGRVFNVKKVTLPDNYADNNIDSCAIFMGLLDRLHNREITGNKARDIITTVLGMYTEDTAKYLVRVLKKDLLAGLLAKTVNEAHPNLIPLFEVMLATKLESNFNWCGGPWQVEHKYDGVRTLAICKGGVTTYFSRSGKPATFLTGIFDEELAILEQQIGRPIVVDSEVMGDSFVKTIKAKGSANSQAKTKLKMHIFDMVTLSDWLASTFTEIQEYRSNRVIKYVGDKSLGFKKLIATKAKICRTKDDVTKFFESAVAKGVEGVIIKDLKATYIRKRSKAWIKWKPVYTYDGTIINFVEGKKGKTIGTLGKVIVEGVDENGKMFRTGCGSGFSEAERDEIWVNRPRYLGATIEMKADAITKAENSEVYSLRFPIFVSIRTDK